MTLGSCERGLCFFTESRVCSKEPPNGDVLSVLQKALLVTLLLPIICLSVLLLSLLENTKVGRGEEGRGGAWGLVT